ncbi:helix-turn-helix domain-containing protein [Verticiella sediminum]|uniref:Helix-turn-helix domain-containing protein n=1 Tax=Verticiella sediminum TaxID=1247510 RepID=A0A556B083_9BURK|nr:helix-turn-helix domain-containing protein [Verticiella sediminum]TSH98586.1 helix-turn-helix domain-containing protein [Verticiella sediminum]
MPAVYVVEIPCFPEAAVGHAAHFVELLRGANLMASLRQGRRAARFAWRWVDAAGTPLMHLPYADEGGAGGAAPDAMFVTSLHCPDIPSVRTAAERLAPLSVRLGALAERGGKVCLLGSGAWLAARSGRCAGRRLALPWFYVAAFGAEFPEVALDAEQDVVEDGPWLSAALAANVGGLAMALAREVLDPASRQALASLLRPDPERARAAIVAMQGQHVPTTRAGTLARAICWLEQRLDQPYCLDELAAAAAVSPRTLLRHFQQEFGHTPLDHLHRLRCARAKVLLEITLESVATIALACGYVDPAAFRRVFVRHTGTTPAAYRAQHSLRAPRRRWRVDPRPVEAAALAALAAVNRPAAS